MNETIKIDDLIFEIRRSPRRRTVEMTVDRLGKLLIAVPAAIQKSDIERIIRQKQMWIYNALDRKRRALHPQPQKEYVTGEGFYYLGRKYRLKIFDPRPGDNNAPKLQLKNGRFLLRRDVAGTGRKQFVEWYTRKGLEWIAAQIDGLKERVAAEPQKLGIRDLKFRWGSCTSKGDVYFHWRTILLPPEIVRYLILHELLHLHEHNHSPAFYGRLERAIPDFREKEAWLERNADKYVL